MCPNPSSIAQTEFVARIERIQEAMARNRLSGLMVYGDEYRRENLRYVCNFWPIFERGACFIPRKVSRSWPGRPEGEKYAREMWSWHDVRNIKEFACVTVPEEIDYPLACFLLPKEILGKSLGEAKGWACRVMGYARADYWTGFARRFPAWRSSRPTGIAA